MPQRRRTQEERRRRRRRRPLERRYGFFRCRDCNRRWESSYVFCIPGTLKVVFKQGCEKCKNMIFPYRTEDIICSLCFCGPCECDEDDRMHHNDAKKPHRRDLCEKCIKGFYCVPDRYCDEYGEHFLGDDGYGDYDDYDYFDY